jgi:CRISPR associated protein Cas1
MFHVEHWISILHQNLIGLNDVLRGTFCNPQSAIRNPQSAIRNPQSAIRNPMFHVEHSAIRNPMFHVEHSEIRNPHSAIHMQLYLDSYGAFLGVRNKMFYLRPRHSDEHVFAVHTIDVIIFTKGITMTSDALMLALENEIPVVFIDAIGHPVGQVWGGRFGSASEIGFLGF